MQTLQIGDNVTTNAIAPNPWEKNGTPAQIIKFQGDDAEVVYGQYRDRAWIPIDSCTFVSHGELSECDKIPSSFRREGLCPTKT